MTTESVLFDDHAISGFLRSWTRLDSQPLTDLLAQSLLVGTQAATTIIGRDAFLAVVRARQAQVGGEASTRLVGWDAKPVGRDLLLVTATWTVHTGGREHTLVSDFLLQAGPAGGLQCAAYLPRQDLTAMMSSEGGPS